MIEYLLIIAAATLAKLASSGDDVLWLLPFVAGKNLRTRVGNAVLYIATLEFVVSLSVLIAWMGDEVVRGFLSDDAAIQFLQFVSVALLGAYAFFLWWKSRKHAVHTEPQHTRGSIILISFLGSLDELSYFPGLLWSNTFTAAQLAIGTALTGLLVVALCLGATRFRAVTAAVAKIPLWLIIGVFALVALLTAFPA